MTFQQRVAVLKNLIETSPLRRELEHGAVRSVALHPTCGDSVCFTAHIKNNTIIDIGTTGEGCLLSKAAGVIAAQYALGKTCAQVRELTDDILIALLELGPIGPTRRQCVSIVVSALHKITGS